MSLPDLVYVVLVVLGIGLVIFVHELGHFMAARWCGARVEVFSLGFGPRLFGWQRGDTLFQVAAVPLGGYVKVAGEYHDGRAPKQPGTLSSLNVPQRFLYYSGGVIMNVIFALVALPLVMFAGMDATQPVVGAPEPGFPAWRAGVPAQSRVLSIGGEEILNFQQLVTAVAVNGKEPIEIVVDPPGPEERRTFRLQPRFDESSGVYKLGLPPGLDPDRRLVVREDTPASRAGLTGEDRFVRVVGEPAALRPERQLMRALSRTDPITLEVLGPDGASRQVEITPTTVESNDRRIGVGALRNRIDAVRADGVAAEVVVPLGLQAGDILATIGGASMRTPREIEDALAALDGRPRIEAQVLRDGEVVALEAPLPAGFDPVRLLEDVALTTNDATNLVFVQPDSAAARAGLRSGDRVLNVDGAAVATWTELLEQIRSATGADRAMDLIVARAPTSASLADVLGGAPTENIQISLRGSQVEGANFGVGLAGATMTMKAGSLGEAVGMGTRMTRRFLIDVWLQLKKMIFSDEISTKNLGGIISISVISFDTASQGMARFFFFLALLSINLAIINLLPIPILDGGHLLFLLIEAVKGSPVSERTFGYSQVVGLVMIMSLMVYVTYQDIVRWILT